MALLPLLSFDSDPVPFRHRSLSHILEPDTFHEWPMMLPTRWDKILPKSIKYKWLKCSRTVDHLRDLRNQLAHFDQGATVTLDKNHFQANIDVQQFRPEEISVRLLDDHSIKVEAKHEEQADDHGLISRYATLILIDNTLISLFKGILWDAICFPKTVTLQNWNPNCLLMEF